MKLKTSQKIIIIAAVAAILIYIFIMFLSANFSMVHTESAVAATLSKTIDTNGYIVRNETYITNTLGGVVSYVNNGGGSVSANGAIAKVYATEQDATAHQQIDKLNTEIERLQKLNETKQVQGTSLEAINSVLNNDISTLIKSLHNNDFYSLEQTRNDILMAINERQVVTGAVLNFNEQIAKLDAQKKSLEATTGAAIGEIKSPIAGYFVDFSDGYENSYDYSKASSMTCDELSQLKEKESQDVPANAIGKVISNLNWYICCPITMDEATEFSDIYDNVKVKMPFATTDSVPVDVMAINKDIANNQAVIVLDCKFISDELAALRNEKVQIDVKTYTGIKISQKAIHDDSVQKIIENDDGTTTTDSQQVKGVYVLHGNELVFKQVDILFSTEDYVICSPKPDAGKLFNGETVELYDKIVTEGADLYAGKIVKQSS